ncbi:MAG TPA: ATP-binding protein [Terriglobales bacterium]|nr:ATP-binding protein [Terriglobales bacterium]
MATPEMRAQAPQLVPQAERRLIPERGRAAFRLLSAERSDEIYPILMEEIVALGFTRALVVSLDLEAGEIHPVAAINCSPSYQQKFTTALWQGENPIVGVLRSLKPAVIPKAGVSGRSIYCHPLLFKNSNACWEAERGTRSCLAVQNFLKPGALDISEQVCRSCEMRAYCGAVIAEMPPHPTDRQMTDVRSLIEVANGYLSRLFKVDHYYNRMRDSDVTIAQMQTLMQSMADPVILTDAQHRVIAQNRAAERFFKLPEKEVTEGAARAVELNNLLFSAALSSMAVSGSSDASRDLTLVDIHEGEEVLFEAVTAPSFSRDGMRSGLVTVMRDVTDLRRADQEFRASMERLRDAQEIVRQDRDLMHMVIENVGDPIIVADGSARVVLLDSLAQELFGRIHEATSGPFRLDTVEPRIVNNQVKLDAYLQAFTFSFSARQDGSLRLYSPENKSEIDFDTRSGKIYDKRGQVSYTITVLRDLSAFRKLEQLKMERRMIEMEKFAATGRLAGTIAHEVNNPMEAIKNAIFLLQGVMRPDALPIYEILKNETDRVARIVRQMLGLYRHSEQVGTIDVNTVIEDTLVLFSRQLERAGIRVERDQPKLPPIVGSPDQFRQVVSNLVINARDSMISSLEGNGTAERPPMLKIRTRHLPAPDGIHGWVRLTIADTGTGIPPEIIKTVFEPFVSTKGEKGTGLGLWIVKGIIENHSGKMRVKSRLGRGTVFKIDLPVVR